MASEITSLKDENFGEIQFLLTEMTNLSKCLNWTGKEKQIAFDNENQPIKLVDKRGENYACNFCKQIGHKIKFCQIFLKSKMKKKSKKKVSVVNHVYSATDIQPKRDKIMPRISKVDQSV